MARPLASLIIAATLLAGAPAVQSQTFPAQPIRLLVPYAAGGATDSLARTLAEVMGAAFGQTMVVDNRPGAASNIAVQALLAAKPDGYTLMNAENATLFFNEHMFARLPYNPARDFSYIGSIGRLPVVMVVTPGHPAKNPGEFVAQARAAADPVNYGSPGIGTSHHMAMEMLRQAAGIKLTHIAYKGGALAVQDVMAGRVPTMMIDLTVGLQFVTSGKLRPMAVAGAQRIKSLPDVPTFGEMGYKDVTAYTIQGLIGPAGMPAALVNTLNAELNKAARHARITALLGDTGFEPIAGTPEEFRTLARSESARWGGLIKAVGVKLD